MDRSILIEQRDLEKPLYVVTKFYGKEKSFSGTCIGIEDAFELSGKLLGVQAAFKTEVVKENKHLASLVSHYEKNKKKLVDGLVLTGMIIGVGTIVWMFMNLGG
jgi:hypothetical protein